MGGSRQDHDTQGEAVCPLQRRHTPASDGAPRPRPGHTPERDHDLRPSPCADPCCRLLLLVAFKGQEKGNVTSRNARLRPAKPCGPVVFLSLQIMGLAQTDSPLSTMVYHAAMSPSMNVSGAPLVHSVTSNASGRHSRNPSPQSTRCSRPFLSPRPPRRQPKNRSPGF